MPSADARTPTLQQELARMAALPQVHAAFAWFANHARELALWQMELTGIPAPPFEESRRAEWVRGRFAALDLQNVAIDAAGNVLGSLPGRGADPGAVLVSAHLDTVFPASTPIDVSREGTRLFGPGISDNGAGLTALLAVAAALCESGLRTLRPVLFAGNVGEEGEGDLRGMRFLFHGSEWADKIAYSVVLDGGGHDTVVTEGLGSRRFSVKITGPGGHSWSDFGTPNPIVLAARIIDRFARTEVPQTPKTTFNIGAITGGTSINAIPEEASFKVDLRSAALAQLDRLEKALRSAVQAAQSELFITSKGSTPPPLHVEIRSIGDRPAAELSSNARILGVIKTVDGHLGIQSRLQRASTDANIPLALGREAVTLGGGGTGGGAHTVHEWYDVTGRELGLRRILLATLLLAGVE